MKENIFNDDDRLYLQLMQENISRIASNSAKCKTYSISIVAAFYALGLNMTKMNIVIYIILIIIMIVLYIIDTYYLSIERQLRNRELFFLMNRRAKSNENTKEYINLLFNFIPLKKTNISKSEMSQGFVETSICNLLKSTSLFYLPIIAIILVLGFISNCY